MAQKALNMQKKIMKTVHLDYLLYLPEDYDKAPDKKWPLILFLHGAGERGENIEDVKRNGIPKIVEDKEDFPFITVSPQCSLLSVWPNELEEVNALLDEIIDNYAVDTKRIYLTGLSMGGYGTWFMSFLYPKRFAAIAPICGGGLPNKAPVIKDIPVWAFHGKKDSVVPFEESKKMVNALKECGGNVKFTAYPDADHDSWTETYNNPKLYQWFLKHKLK